MIARNSSSTYKGQAIDVKRIGRELGVRYVLEGSVRKGGNRVRIAAQLIEAETGVHLWADRFDGALEDVFDLQDQVASSVAGVIEPALQVAEIRRSTIQPTTNLSAYDLYMRGLAAYPPRTKDKLSEALALFEKQQNRSGFRLGIVLGRSYATSVWCMTVGPRIPLYADGMPGVSLIGHSRWLRATPGPGQCGICSDHVRRGHQRELGVKPARAFPQSEFRARLVSERLHPNIRGSARCRHQAFRNLMPPEPPRAHWVVFIRAGAGVFFHAPIRESRVAPADRD